MAAPSPDDSPALALCSEGALSVAAAAAEAGVSRSTLYSEMQAGRLRYVQRGRRRLVPRRALAEWLAAGLVAPEADGGA